MRQLCTRHAPTQQRANAQPPSRPAPTAHHALARPSTSNLVPRLILFDHSGEEWRKHRQHYEPRHAHRSLWKLTCPQPSTQPISSAEIAPTNYGMTLDELEYRVEQLFAENFGVVSCSQLGDVGVGKSARQRLIRRDRLHHVRRGWYRNSSPAPLALRAVRAGGVVTGLSALSMRGVWTRSEPQLHVRASRTDLISGQGFRRVALQEHHAHPCQRSVDSISVALAVTLRHSSLVDGVIAVDAIRNARMMDDIEIEHACRDAGTLGRRIWLLSDAGAGSGIETLFRLWLVKHRIPFRTQVPIAGVGIVDFLIGNVIVEVDGFAYHGTNARFHSDRARDLALKALGYRVVRLSYMQVMHELETLTPALLSLLKRRR